MTLSWHLRLVSLCLPQIESEIRKLADVWREQRFELGKYMKGPEDRGWVLRSTEDILVLLEDMGLNLQSMMASPFVRPFLTEVGQGEGGGLTMMRCVGKWVGGCGAGVI